MIKCADCSNTEVVASIESKYVTGNYTFYVCEECLTKWKKMQNGIIPYKPKENNK